MPCLATLRSVKLLLENLPPSLHAERDTLARCLRAMDAALPLRRVILFGSHARGEAGPESDVDLCLVADGAEKQVAAGTRCYSALWGIWPRPGLTLVPITPQRLAEKKASRDHFFHTVMEEGVAIAAQD